MYTAKRDGTNIPQCLANLPRYHPARQSFPIIPLHNNNTITPTNSPSQSTSDSDSDEHERSPSPPPPYQYFASDSEQLDTLKAAEEGRYEGVAAMYRRRVYVAQREKVLRKMQRDHAFIVAAARRQRERPGPSDCIVVFFIVVIVLWVLVLAWLFLDKAMSG